MPRVVTWEHKWKVVDTEPATIRLNYFVQDQRAIERGFMNLATDHLLCLAAFDDCYDRALSRDRSWEEARGRVQAAGRRLFAEAGRPQDGEQ